MREIRFRNWAEVLARLDLPERQKASWTITIRWYLGFCRRSRAGVTVQSAREFIVWAQQEKQAKPWQVERWKEPIRWYFQQAKASAGGQKAEATPDKGANQRANPQQTKPNAQCPTSKLQPQGGNEPRSVRGRQLPAWKIAFLTTVRRRHLSYRTEQSYLVWLERFARFCRTDDLQSRGPEDIKRFLDELALQERLSASSQRQARGWVEG